MKGCSRVIEQIVVLRWTMNRLARIMALKQERAVRCAVNAALEKEGRSGMKLTGRIELTEWENTEEKNEID